LEMQSSPKMDAELQTERKKDRHERLIEMLRI
jgi:hypothetical protein